MVVVVVVVVVVAVVPQNEAKLFIVILFLPSLS